MVDYGWIYAIYGELLVAVGLGAMELELVLSVSEMAIGSWLLRLPCPYPFWM